MINDIGSNRYQTYYRLLWAMLELELLSNDQYWRIHDECRDKLEELHE